MSHSRTTRTSSTVPSLREVTSSVHQGQLCNPCILCKKENQSKYFHPKSWKDHSLLKRLQEYEPTLDIRPESCICRPCRNEVSDIGSDGFTPRWRKNNIMVKCFVSGCTGTDIKITKITDRETLQAFFCGSENALSMQPSTELKLEGTPLCTYHYGAWYRHVNPSHLKCTTCSKSITEPKSRPFPEPTLLQTFLRENTDYSKDLCPQDRVCCACYRSHLFTIKHLKNLVKSTDSDLRALIDKLKQDLPVISDVLKFDSALQYVTSTSAIWLGEALLKQTAMLLPQVYATFKEKLLKITNEHGIAITQDLPSHAWLRSHLSSLLEHHIAYCCSVNRFNAVSAY